jgi:hypothetical protein
MYYFYSVCIWTALLHDVRCEIFHHVCTEKALDFWVFQISDFWIRDVQPVPNLASLFYRWKNWVLEETNFQFVSSNGRDQVQDCLILEWDCTQYLYWSRMWLLGDPRWQLECRSRQCELCKSKILLRSWSHTWQKKKHQEESTLWHPEQACTRLLHAAYTEKPGGLLRG